MNRHESRLATGDELLMDLLSDPDAFEARGSANELLKRFLRGYPTEHLNVLLRHPNEKVLAAGIWIASELPQDTPAFLDDAIRAAAHANIRIRYYALDVIALGTRLGREGDFVNVVSHLEDPHPAVRENALRLLSSSTDGQLRAAIERLELAEPKSHHLDLLRLLLDGRLVNPAEVEKMILGEDPLPRIYGIAIAERLYEVYPNLLSVASRVGDEDISSAAGFMLQRHKA